jgi:hypothetical protein
MKRNTSRIVAMIRCSVGVLADFHSTVLSASICDDHTDRALFAYIPKVTVSCTKLGPISIESSPVPGAIYSHRHGLPSFKSIDCLL